MADTETFAVSLTRLGLIVVLFWIGGLKIAPPMRRTALCPLWLKVPS